MTAINGFATLIGRILLATIFIWSGWGKIADIGGTAAYIGSAGIPGDFAWPAAFFELFGGLFILIGYQTRIVAAVFAGFCVITAFLFHTNFADAMQQINFFKNLAMAGGFLVLASDPANPYSVDHFWAGKAQRELDVTPGATSASEG